MSNPSTPSPDVLPHLTAMLEEVPVGLLLVDADLAPLWFNAEAARACAVWNHGERRAAALRAQRDFQLPAPLAEACRALLAAAPTAAPAQVVSDHQRGLHARVQLSAPTGRPPVFHVQLDYRRPRGDRHRPLSPGAVALLARLSEREREVAMRVREGHRNTEIAAELRRSPLTIKTQLASIYAKLSVRGRTQVAALLNR